MKLSDNIRVLVYSFFNMNYNFLVISNLSKHERKLALNIKNFTLGNKAKIDLRLCLKKFPNIMNGLSYIQEFAFQFTIVVIPNIMRQNLTFYDFFVQTMPKSIAQNVKISYEIKMRNYHQISNLYSVKFFNQKYKLQNCFNKFILNETQTNDFRNLQKEVGKFQVFKFKECFIGGQTLLEKQIQYNNHFLKGNVHECNSIEQEFQQINLSKFKSLNLKELKIDSSVILDSQMFMQFTKIEKLSVKDSIFNQFTINVIHTFHKLQELNMMNFYYPQLDQISYQQIKDHMTTFSIPRLKLFKNLIKLTFCLYQIKELIEIKRILEDNFNRDFDLTIYCNIEISLNDICDHGFYKTNFKVKFITNQLTLIDINKFPQLRMNELSKLINEKNNLQITQEVFSQIGIQIYKFLNQCDKYQRKSIFSVRVEKDKQIQIKGKLEIIKLHFDLFLFDYYGKEAKLSLFYKN